MNSIPAATAQPTTATTSSTMDSATSQPGHAGLR
jgi:hypothetical protein